MMNSQRFVSLAAAATLFCLVAIVPVVWIALHKADYARTRYQAMERLVTQYETAGQAISSNFLRAVLARDAKTTEAYFESVNTRYVLAEELRAKGIALGLTAETDRFARAILAVRAEFEATHVLLRAAKYDAALARSPVRDPHLLEVSGELRAATATLLESVQSKAGQTQNEARALLRQVGVAILVLLVLLGALWSWVVYRLTVITRAVQLAKQRLAGQAEELERQVNARTAELAETQVDLVEALDELNRSHELMAEMSAIANIGAWEVEVETGQRRWSMQTKRMLGLPADYDPGSVGAFAFVNPSSLEVYKSAHAGALDGVPFDIEVQGTLSGGREIWGRLIGRPVFENDRVVRVAGSFQDVTAEYRRRAELEKARAEADAANAAKGAFLANMSHEIRTPLNGVIGIAGALARTPLTAQQQEMVALVQSSGETLQRLLGDILDLSRMEAGRLELRLDAVDLRDAVDAAAEVMRAQAEEKGLRFKINYAENARGLFRADAVRLRQVISNLTSNAVKFTEHGEINVDVRVDEAAGADAIVAIDIRDTGIGFDEATAQRLFGRFEQADSGIARQFGGSGLGLSISRSLARLMGGDITAVSRPGEGSTFQLRLNLPRTMPLEAYDRHRAALEQAVVGVPMMENESALRILVAEDHPVNQQVVRLILEPCGVALTFAANGREAVEAFGVAPFDAILMDMQMPEMDGLAATRAIRALEAERGLPRTPIAMLSANAMAEHVEQARAAGCDLHIAKPITPDTLIDGIDQLMAQTAEDDAPTALSA